MNAKSNVDSKDYYHIHAILYFSSSFILIKYSYFACYALYAAIKY